MTGFGITGEAIEVVLTLLALAGRTAAILIEGFVEKRRGRSIGDEKGSKKCRLKLKVVRWSTIRFGV